MNTHYIGPAGWSYKDWEGIVYPGKKTAGWHSLRYLSSFFNTIEINSSFYCPPAAQTAAKWVELVSDNPNFLFTCKLWQEFTHTKRLDVCPAKTDPMLDALYPLANAGRLGAVLIQFPWSFKYSQASLDRLHILSETFHEFPLVVEIRHASWNQAEFFSFLERHKMGFANVDQPVIGESIPLTQYITSDVGYVRLHGRNYETWFANDATAATRYDYFYTESEISGVLESIEALITNSPKAFMIFNNHYRGQAIANALQSIFLMDHEKLVIPGNLAECYPELQKIATSSDAPGQMSMF